MNLLRGQTPSVTTPVPGYAPQGPSVRCIVCFYVCAHKKKRYELYNGDTNLNLLLLGALKKE